MKPGTIMLMKFKRLRATLQVTTTMLIGLLEHLWLITARNAPDGAIGRVLTNRDIATELDWVGEPDALIEAMVSEGWIDAHPEHRLIIHDWPEHCPRYIKGNLKSHGKQFAIAGRIEQAAKQPAIATHSKQPASLPFLSSPILSSTPPTPSRGNSGGKPKSKSPKIPIPENLDTPEFRAKWADWIKDRKARRNPVTPLAAARQMAMLMEFTPAVAVAIIDRSITNGWTGLFPPDGNGKKPKVPAQLRDEKPTARPTPPLVIPDPTGTERAAAGRWEEIKVVLVDTIDPESFSTWIDPLICTAAGKRGVWLVAPSEFHRNFAANSHTEDIVGAAGAVLGGVPELYIVADERDTKDA